MTKIQNKTKHYTTEEYIRPQMNIVTQANAKKSANGTQTKVITVVTAREEVVLLRAEALKQPITF